MQNYLKTLGDRAVAYLNVDIAVSGTDYLKLSTVPILHHLVDDVAKRVRMPFSDLRGRV